MKRRWTCVAVLACLAAGCGGSTPTGPSEMSSSTSSATQLQGDWSGLARVTSCADSTFGHCDYLPPFVAFTFTFEKGADGWRGTVTFAEPRPLAVQVSGVEAADGRGVTFSGATTPSSAGGEMATG